MTLTARPSGVQHHRGSLTARLARVCVALSFTPLLFGLLGMPLGAGLQSAHAATSAGLRGRVVDAATGDPVAGATILAPGIGVAAKSNRDGRFEVPEIPISQNVTLVDFSVRAPQWGEWSLKDARLIAGDTLILTVQLKKSPVTIQVPTPKVLETMGTSGQVQIAGPKSISPPLADQTSAPLPTTIRVRITGNAYCNTSLPYTVETIDFKDYAKHVLAAEWNHTWVGESVRAGAMAVKMYAWSYIIAGGKWPDADVYDSTCDQYYNPAVEYASTNAAVDFTWNWRMTWNSTKTLVRTFYRAYSYMCADAGLSGYCMGQVESNTLATNRYTWDEILAYFYTVNGGIALTPVWDPPGGYSLRFEGNGNNNLDRVNIKLDAPPRPIDIGSVGEDFSIEWWMKATPGENGTTACSSGDGDWLSGNTFFDRDISGPGDYGEYGISLMNGRIAFGVNNGTSGATLCGSTNVADGSWHHVAVQRRSSDGQMQIYIDGTLDDQSAGPAGDLSYRDNRTPAASRDPFLVIGAEKFDTNNSLYPSFFGWITEIRISDSLRYGGAYPTPSARFSPDGSTVGLYHFGEGYGDPIHDTSGASGGPSDGLREYGGGINGPEWTYDSPWYVPPPTPTIEPTPHTLYLPLIMQDGSALSSGGTSSAQAPGAATILLQLTGTPTPGGTR